MYHCSSWRLQPSSLGPSSLGETGGLPKYTRESLIVEEMVVPLLIIEALVVPLILELLSIEALVVQLFIMEASV